MELNRRYKVFYSIASSRPDVPAEAPVEMSLEEVCNDLFPKLQQHDDFLGLVDERDGCFQVRIEGEFLLDVPIPARQGALQLLVDEHEALRRLRSIPQAITAEAFPDFRVRTLATARAEAVVAILVATRRVSTGKHSAPG